MISCHEFLAELGDYLENDAAVDVRRQVEDHLAHCRTCQVLYDSLHKTLHLSPTVVPLIFPRQRPH